MSELGAALSKGGKSLEPDAVKALLLKMDKNLDGFISFDEFEQIFTLAPGSLPSGIK